MKYPRTPSCRFIALLVSAMVMTGINNISSAASRPATSRQQAPRKNVAKSTTLTVKCNVPNATVTQDGIILGTAGSPFEVDPGNAILDVSAPGYQTKKVQTTARPNVANTVNVVLVKLAPVKKPAPVARPAQTAKRQAQSAAPRGQAKVAGKSAPSKGGAPRKGQDLFGDDFAGASAGPPPAIQSGPITGPASSPPRTATPPRQQVARQNRQPQQRPQQQPQQRPAAAPQYEPGYGPGTSMPAQPGYQQPYAQPYPQTPVYPQYPGYQPYPQYPSAPGYGAYPGYAPGYPPGYAPGYPAPGYQVPQYQAPSPYYYYPQQPPAIVAPAPVEPVAPPSVAEAPLPSVAEAPSQSGPPPVEELAPAVGATKKASSGRNPVIKYLPFGAGQYQNGNYVLGGAFTAAQAGALVLYITNSSNAASAQTNYNKAIAARDDAVNNGDRDGEAYYEDQANQQKAYGTTSDQNATLCLLGFGAAWVASTVEASINAPSGKGPKKSRSRRRGLAFETGLDEHGLEAQISYNF